jgi:hypothetical protein
MNIRSDSGIIRLEEEYTEISRRAANNLEYSFDIYLSISLIHVHDLAGPKPSLLVAFGRVTRPSVACVRVFQHPNVSSSQPCVSLLRFGSGRFTYIIQRGLKRTIPSQGSQIGGLEHQRLSEYRHVHSPSAVPMPQLRLRENQFPK